MRFGAAAATLAVALAAVGSLVSPAAAQQVTLEPSAAMACLTPAAADRGAPEFPFVAYKTGLAGRVKVALIFTTPATRPAVKVLEQDGDSSFIDAVEDHVRSLRLPCHDGGGTPVRLVIEYVFRKDDRQVHWSHPVDPAAPVRRAMLGCLVHTSGRMAPDYPRQALQQGVQGRVLARLRFDAPDRAPSVETFGRRGAAGSARANRQYRLLADVIESWAAGYRMPCYQGLPISTTLTFVYRIEGEAYGFRPGIDMVALLASVRGIRQQKLDFDFNQMDCPFDVQMQYRQPWQANLVGEVGGSDPARRPFLDWLAGVDFDLPAANLNAIYGDTATFTVPCLKINLNPQE